MRLSSRPAKWLDYCARNGFSPWDEDDPDRPEAHFGGYVSRRVNGMILDWCRHQDHVTRSTRIKAIQAAQDAGARTEDELAEVTGLPVGKIREAQAAEVARPVSLDDTAASADFGHQGLADDSADGDTESAAVVRQTLASFLAAFDSLPAVQHVLLALRFHQELDITVAAKAVHLEPAEAQRLADEAVCQIHGRHRQQIAASRWCRVPTGSWTPTCAAGWRHTTRRIRTGFPHETPVVWSQDATLVTRTTFLCARTRMANDPGNRRWLVDVS